MHRPVADRARARAAALPGLMPRDRRIAERRRPVVRQRRADRRRPPARRRPRRPRGSASVRLLCRCDKPRPFRGDPSTTVRQDGAVGRRDRGGDLVHAALRSHRARAAHRLRSVRASLWAPLRTRRRRLAIQPRVELGDVDAESLADRAGFEFAGFDDSANRASQTLPGFTRNCVVSQTLA